MINVYNFNLLIILHKAEGEISLKAQFFGEGVEGQNIVLLIKTEQNLPIMILKIMV